MQSNLHKAATYYAATPNKAASYQSVEIIVRKIQ